MKFVGESTLSPVDINKWALSCCHW